MDKNEMRQMLQNALDSVDEAKNTLEELKEEFEDEEKEESSDLKCPMNVFYMSLADVDKLVYGKFSALVFHPGDVIVSGKFRFRVIDVGNMQSINARPDERHVLLRIEQFITDGTPFDNDGCNEWEKSSMRKYLNGEFLEMLSEEDRSAVKYVELHTGRKDAVSTDRVFLLSAKELGFDVDEAGKALPFFTGENAADSRIYTDGDGDARWYFTRSPYPGGALSVRYVSTDGSLNSINALNGFAAVPACMLI